MNKFGSLKRIIPMFLVLFVMVFYTLPIEAKADTKFGRLEDVVGEEHLIVSMVYDDSGSMEGEKGTYCNYTFQLFISLFSEKDELFVTYMSKPTTSSNYSIRNNRQARINNLRNHENKIFTPIAAVRTAYERLLNEDGDENENDSYWLIVLTDGYFYDDGNTKVLSQEEVNSYFQSYADTVMHNGEKINILYVGIGDEVTYPELREGTDNLTVIQTLEPEDIMDVLTPCAEVFTECINSDKVKFVETKAQENKISLTTSVPLERIILIENDIPENDSSTVWAYDSQGKYFLQSEELSVYHSYMNYETGLRTRLEGRVTYWENEDYFKDSFEIVLDNEVDLSKIMIYVNPAIDLQVEYYDENNYLVDINKCSMKDVLKARLALINLDSNEEIDPNLLGNEQTRHIVVMDSNNNMCLAEGVDPVLIDISMVDEGMIVKGEYSFSNAEAYHVVEPIALYKSIINDSEKIEYERTGLVGNKSGFEYCVTVNEKPFSRSDMSKMNLEVTPEKKIWFLRYSYSVKNDGRVSIRPSFGYKGFLGNLLVNWLSVWLIPTDGMELNITASDMFGRLVLSDNIIIDYNKGPTALEIWYYYYPFLMTALIVGFFVKRRFKFKQVIYYIMLAKDEDNLVPYWKRWQHVSLRTLKIKDLRVALNPYSFIPFVANARRCGVLKVYAAYPFYKKEDGVLLDTRGCDFTRIEEFEFEKVSKISIDYATLKEGFENQKHASSFELKNGGFVAVRKDNEIYLYHLGRVR